MTRQRMLSIAATVVILLPSWLLGGEGEIPPPENWVTVKTVSTEFTHVRSQPCSCGGAYEVVVQSTGEFKDRNYDHLHCRCRQCGERRDFYFDVTGIFAEYKLSQSDEAKAAADAVLDRRFPIVTAESLPALKGLIDDENPHVRAWGITRIAKLNLPEAREFLLNRYMEAGLIGSVQFQSALKEMGAELLPLIEQRFENPENAASFALMNLLEDIPLPPSARLVERELHREMQKDEGERRICYITLGQLAFKESESILLSAFEKEQVSPDDSLIWALGRCGTEKSILTFGRHFGPTTRTCASLQLWRWAC